MKEKIRNIFLADPHRAVLFSFPLYVLFSNIILNFWRLAFYHNIKLDLIGTYCKATDLPDGSFKLLAYSLALLLSKYFVITGISLIILKKIKPINIIISLWMIDWLLLDGVALLFYFIEDYFGGFKYFLAGNHIYLLGRELYLSRWIFSFLNFIAGNFLLVFILKKYNRLSIKEIGTHYLYLIAGVILIVLILESTIAYFL